MIEMTMLLLVMSVNASLSWWCARHAKRRANFPHCRLGQACSLVAVGFCHEFDMYRSLCACQVLGVGLILVQIFVPTGPQMSDGAAQMFLSFIIGVAVFLFFRVEAIRREPCPGEP